MKKKQSILFSVLAVSLIIAAFFLANRIFSDPTSIKLDTIVYHVCENKRLGNITIHIPNVTSVYQQVLTANNGTYPNILLFPT